MITANIIRDSISPSGARLTTFELTYPRFIHAQFMTHRVFSRNAASSRAIPAKKMIERIKDNPAKVVWWGKNQSGMQAHEELDLPSKLSAQSIWNHHLKASIAAVEALISLQLHKQIANRLLEPFMNITVICTGTDWDNFFYLRCGDAQPEISQLAYKMLNALYNSTPQLVEMESWHTPYLQPDEESLDEETKIKLSVARCARVSYLTHSGVRSIDEDLSLYQRLYDSRHLSPFEHVAKPLRTSWRKSGNFTGWHQHRKDMEIFPISIPTKEEVEEYLKSIKE